MNRGAFDLDPQMVGSRDHDDIHVATGRIRLRCDAQADPAGTPVPPNPQ
jgi:hypothetical protein